MFQETRTAEITHLKRCQDAIAAYRIVVADQFGGRRTVDDAKRRLLAEQAEARHVRNQIVRRRREQQSRLTELLH